MGCKEEPLCIPAELLRNVIQNVLGRQTPEPSGAKQMCEEGYTALCGRKVR